MSDRTILYVEDNEFNRKIVRDLLAAWPLWVGSAEHPLTRLSLHSDFEAT